MIGRKKKRDQDDEKQDEGLHKHKSVYEYQNKCLCTMIEDYKDKLLLKERELSIIQKQFTNLQQIFIHINSQLSIINTSASIVLKEYKLSPGQDIELHSDKYFSYSYEILSKILSSQEDITKDSGSLTQVNDLVNSINSLIKNILPIIKDSERMLTCDPQNEFNSELQSSYAKLMEQYSHYQNDMITLKTQNKSYECQLKESQLEITNLNNKIFKLNRKINTNPLLPYINWEEKLLDKQIEEHNCTCVLCGKELGSNTSGNQPNNTYTQGEIMSNMNYNAKDNESNNLLILENEALKSRIKELHDKLERFNGECEITEDNLLQSSQFQSLVSQAESILFQLDSLKETNEDLIKKNSSLNQIKEGEVRQIQQNFTNIVEQFQKTIYDSSKILENNKYSIQLLLNMIESLENNLKSKDSLDLNSMYEIFTSERVQLMKQMESMKILKKEYLNKYDDECEKNKTMEKTINKLTHELNEYKQQYSNDEKNSIRKRSYDYTNEEIQKKQEKILSLKNEISRLESELEKARKYNDRLIGLVESNENGVSHLNLTMKNTKLELQQEKEIHARMSNEKLKDNHTIILLKEAKDILERKVSIQQDQLENYDSYTKKIESELVEQRRLNSLCEENKRLNENDIEKLKKENVNNLKEIERIKIFMEDYQKQLIESKSTNIKQLTNFDLLKVKYEELCKFKKYDSSLGNYEKLKTENEMLQMENSNYRTMVHCKVCKTNYKNAIITKCFHTFCKSCVEETFENRKRRCPICREQISQNDVKDIYWD